MDKPKATQSHQMRTAHTQAALRHLRSSLQAIYGQDAPRLVIYGSEARRDATETSDVDILLIYRHTINRGEEVRRPSAALAEINLDYDLLISVLPVVEAEYQTAKGPVWTNVRREGVTLERI